MRHETLAEVATSASEPGSAIQFDAITLFSESDHPRLGLRDRADASVVLSWQFASIQGMLIVIVSEASGFGYHKLAFGYQNTSLAFVAVGLVAAALFVGGMRMIDVARRLRKPSGWDALRDVSVMWLCTNLLITFLTFSLKAGNNLSRGSLLSFLVLGYLVVMGGRALLPTLLTSWTRVGTPYGGDVLIVGAENRPMAARIAAELLENGHSHTSIIALNADCSEGDWNTELRTSLGKIFSEARKGGHGDICIAAEGISASRLRDITEAIRIIPRAVQLVPDPVIEPLLHLPLRAIGSVYSIELQKSPMGRFQRVGKRTLDLLISISAIIFLAPLLMVIALAIKLDSAGPVLFVQRRMGYRSKAFGIFKFRTMKVMEDGNDVRQATVGDIRITRMGRWLRKSSVDELPQLMNVIRGEMSLVGPRPHALAHDSYYSKRIAHYEARQHVKPGITGWAQVNGLRGETASDDIMRRRIDFDIWYATNSSLWLDIKILIFTVAEVFKQRNAR